MGLTVTLHVFSGRPNPVWNLPDEAATEFQERVARLARTARQSNLKPAGVLGGLGYRGFSAQVDGQPVSTYVHAGVLDPGGRNPTLLTEDREIEAWLFASSRARIPDAVDEHVRRSLTTSISQIEVINPWPRLICPICTAEDAPLLNTPIWNTNYYTETKNNCYNYANDRMTDTFAQPGRASGHPFTQDSVCLGAGSVEAAAESDGLTTCPGFGGPLPAGSGFYVALVLWPGADFHWYRQDKNGCWSHKIGEETAHNTDNSHKLISSPQTADRGPYTQFCSFMDTRSTVQIS